MRSPGIDTVEWESCLARNVEPGDGQRIHLALALSLGRALLKLLQTILKAEKICIVMISKASEIFK